jgi:hypothetical protein
MVRLKFLKFGSNNCNFTTNVKSINPVVETVSHGIHIPIDVDITGLRIVISYSLYGKADMYIESLVINCGIINDTFPDFWIYIYIGNDFDHSIIERLNAFNNIKIIETGVSGHRNAAYRFTTIDCDEVGVAFSRDCDSYVNRRDKYCIRKFLETNKKFQIIRDNLSHYTEIMAGMWGVKKGMLQFKILERINEFYSKFESVKFGIDQVFLSNEIYPHVRDYSQVFDEFYHYPGENPEKIQTEHRWNSYNNVGAVSPNISLMLE